MPPMAAVLARNVWGTSGGQSMSRQMRGSPGMRPAWAHCPIHSSPYGRSGGMPRPFMYGQPGRPGFNPYGRPGGQPGSMPGAGCASGTCGNMGTQPMYGQYGGSPRVRPPYPYPRAHKDGNLVDQAVEIVREDHAVVTWTSSPHMDQTFLMTNLMDIHRPDEQMDRLDEVVPVDLAADEMLLHSRSKRYTISRMQLHSW